MTTETEMGVGHLPARSTKDCWHHHELEEARVDPALELHNKPNPTDP